jgi:glycosyltransferase involved in cell wall biosynthesis
MEDVMRVVLVCLSNLRDPNEVAFTTYGQLNQSVCEVYTVTADNFRGDFNYGEQNLLFSVPDRPTPTPQSLIMMLGRLSSIRKAISRLQPDVVHFLYKHIWNVPLILLLKHRYKIVHTFHDPVGHEGESVAGAVRKYNKIVAKLVDAIVLHNMNAVTMTEQAFHPKGKVYYAPLAGRMMLPYIVSDRIHNRLLIFGRLANYKGLEHIPAIAAEVAKCNPNIRIVVAGKSRDDVAPAVLKAIADCPNIDYTDAIISDEQFHEYFNTSDAILVTYTSISQSGVIRDAYNHSKPIIAFDIDGIREFTANDEWLVPAFDVAAFARKACDLVSDLEVLRGQSNVAWTFGRCNFSNVAMINAFMEAYEEILT